MADLKISQLTGATTPLAGTEVVPLVQSSSTKKVSVVNLTAGRSVEVDRLGVNIAAPATQIHVQNTTELRAVVTPTANLIQLWKDAGASYAVAFGLNKPGDALGSQFKVSYTTGGAWTDGYTLDSSGNLSVNTGNLVVGTSGKGIDFSADASAAGMTSELLDDYEEGTFTPVVVGTSTAGTGTYVNQVGYYTKVGRQVNIQVFLEWTAHTGTGTILVTGLPFTSLAGVSPPLAAIAYNLTLNANHTLGARVLSADTRIDVIEMPIGGGAWNGAPMDTAVDALLITGTYFV
jgi:hypothetical protein